MKVFFAYSPAQNIHRIRTVLDYWLSKGHEAVGFFSYNGILKESPDDIKRCIDECVDQSIATVILLDTDTSEDQWVRYAARASHERKHALMAIHVHNIPDADNQRSKIGNDRFGELEQNLFFWQQYPTYRWVIDDGAHNIFQWVEEAYQKRSSR